MCYLTQRAYQLPKRVISETDRRWVWFWLVSWGGGGGGYKRYQGNGVSHIDVILSYFAVFDIFYEFCSIIYTLVFYSLQICFRFIQISWGVCVHGKGTKTYYYSMPPYNNGVILKKVYIYIYYIQLFKKMYWCLYIYTAHMIIFLW